MKFYRNQPQSDSHIYRSVFIEYMNADTAIKVSDIKNKNAATEPEIVSGRNTIYGTESRGDIILFYNKIFVPKMQQFAMRFSTSSSQVCVIIFFRKFQLSNTVFWTEQLVVIAVASRSSNHLTKKNMGESRCLRATFGEIQRPVTICYILHFYSWAESLESMSTFVILKCENFINILSGSSKN